MGKRLTTEGFIERARVVHGDKYDYSKVEYKDTHTKVCIVCNEHGEFWQLPYHHLNGCGCDKCARKSNRSTVTKTKEQFIEEAINLYGDLYSYSNVDYINSKTKVCIICPIHGEFWVTPNHHLKGHKCPKCGIKERALKRRMSQSNFIEKARKVHGDKYDYTKVEYINAMTKVCIICPIHGEFWQIPSSHLRGVGCTECAYEENSINQTYDTNTFIELAKKVHQDKYDYSKVKYIDSHTKVKIVCYKHGEFLQTPNSHLNGQGCPKCKSSRLERITRLSLLKRNFEFEEQKKFSWLGLQSLDFYLPKYNIAIECQGIQHYKPIKHFGGKDKFDYTQRLDKLKKKLCEEHGVKIHYIKYDENVENKVKEILSEYAIH